MGGALERLETVDLEDVVDPAGQHSTDTRDRAEEPLGVERAPQPLEQAPSPGGEDLVYGGRDARADAGQTSKCLRAAAGDQRADVLRQPGDRVGGPEERAHAERIGLLPLEELSGLAQPGRDRPVPRC